MTNQSCILVVEDNESVRELLATRLERRGYAVETAANGREALAVMRQHVFDLILLDIMMPEMNGYDVLKHLKADEELSQIPVIVLSAINDLDSVVTCVELGAEDYLFKPINSSLLWARLTTSLEKKHLRDQEKNHLAELATLQQIDRDLNTSLDVDKVAQITLSWARQQTEAGAGLFAVITDDGLEVRAVAGLDDKVGQVIPSSDLDVAQIIEECRIHRHPLAAGEGFLDEALARIIVPICREQIAHSVILLESQRAFDDQAINFLARLSDHAAIALNNAQLYEKAQAADRAKSDFVAFVAHELKTPLSIIMAYGDLLRGGRAGTINEKQLEYLNSLREGVLRMDDLVTELDDITRIETGRLQLEPEAISITEAIEKTLQSLMPQISRNQQTVSVEIASQTPAVWADRKRLSQIMTNLLNNASKYTPEKGHICISAGLKSHDDRATVQIAIQDNGIGISEADRPRIFTQFFRAGDHRVKALRGAGLGLNITQQLVNLHGGKIWFESTFRQGTTFYFTLPVAKASESGAG